MGVGTYDIVYSYTDEDGCTNTAEQTITVNDLPEVTLQPFDNVCLNAPVFDLEGGMPEGGVYFVNGDESTTFDPLAIGTGTHNITYSYTDANGCSASATQSIEVSQSPCVTITHEDITCNGLDNGKISVEVTCGDVTEICLVTPTGDLDDCLDGKRAPITSFNGLTPGLHYVVVKDANGCNTIEEVMIEEPAPLVAEVTAINAVCHGDNGSATIEVTGGTEPYTVNWNGANPADLPVGTYTVDVTDDNNCTTSETFTITQPDPVAVTINPQPTSCSDSDDGSMNITVTGGGADAFNICISDSEGYFDCQEVDVVDGEAAYSSDSELSAGVYSIIITDNNGCTIVENVEIVSPQPLEVSTEVTDPLCFDSTGSVTFDISGGTPDYTIDWQGLDPEDLPAGSYNIDVSDANGCSVTVPFTIAAPPSAITISADITNLQEYGDGTGEISLNVSGGTPPYTYMWDNGENTSTISDLQAGVYPVTVYDSNGCYVSDEFEVTHPSTLADLEITIGVDIPAPNPDSVEVITFGLAVINHDTENDATGVTVTNILPEEFPYLSRLDDGTSGSFSPETGTWNIGTVPAGEYVILVYETGMLLEEEEETEEKSESATNSAQILEFDQIDPDLSNNYAEVMVTVGESTGGDDNGIESNGSMASQLALRNHRRLVESNVIEKVNRVKTMNRYDHTDMLIGNIKSAVVDGLPTSGISMMLPETGPAQTKAYVSTPSDLIGITNAKEIFAVDYLQENNARRGAILAVSTESNSVYEHTKVICDRLVGANLNNIKTINIAGQSFLLSELRHPDGYIDYAVSFIAQRNGNGFVIDNRWYNEEYEVLNTGDVFNFQVWSVTPQITKQLVEDILDLMEQTGDIQFRNEQVKPEMPKVFVKSGKYINGGIMMEIVNTVGADQITIHGNKTLIENGQREPMELTIDIPTTETSEVFVPTGFIFDAGFSVSNNKDNAPDVLYYADGAWMFDYDPGNAFVSDFSTVAEDTELNVTDYYVERDASFSGTVRTWASMFRTLSPRNAPVDLTSFDEIVFNASGKGTIELLLAKESIHNWGEQYRTHITLSGQEKEYRISFDEFANKEGANDLTVEDIVSVVFNPIGNGNAVSEFEVNVNNMHFTNSMFVEKPGAVFYPAYPNPFSGQTHLDLILTQDNDVKVEVMNSFGQTVEVIMNKSMKSGNHKINWNPANVGAGIYMIKVSVGSETYTTKVIYQK